MSQSGYPSFGMVIRPPDDEQAVLPREVRRLPQMSETAPGVVHKPSSGVNLASLLPTPIIRTENTPAVYVPPRQLDANAEGGIALQKDSIEDTFGEMVQHNPFERSVPLVVLDCANIGWCYGVDSFSAEGVNIALRYFQQLQLEVQGFLPASYLRAKPSQADSSRGNAMMLTEDIELLNELAGTALLTIVPSGDSDDAYILNYARDNNGFVISNDLFHDHLRGISNESIRRSMCVWLQDHRCGYAFSARKEFLFNPSSLLREAVQLHLEQQWAAQQEQQLSSELTDLTLSISSGSPGVANPANTTATGTMGPGLTAPPLHLPILHNNTPSSTQITSMIESISALINTTAGLCSTAKAPLNTGESTDCSETFIVELKWLLLTRASLLRKVSFKLYVCFALRMISAMYANAR